MMSIQGNAYYQQYGFVTTVGILGNVYGPNHTFDLESSPVIPALVRKFVEATERRSETVTVWGTGIPTRDFIFVSDTARGLLLAAERYDHAELVNISSGEETSIRELVRMLIDLTGFKGDVVWDASRPEGAPRRRLDISRARTDLGFQSEIALEEGLERTIKWFKDNRTRARLSVD
jgi:nucleoside-diphosphate-sugar epimerase